MAGDNPDARAKKRTGLRQLSEITQIFLSNQDAIKRFLGRFLYRQQDIDDVAQETFLKAYSAEQDKEKGKDIQHPKAYLFQIARNAALEGLRKKSSQIADQIVDFDDNSITGYEGSIEAMMEAEEYIGEFCQAAAQLTPKCRRVFLMRKVYGFSYKEITERLGISLSTAEKHMRNGMLQTSAYMRENSDFDEQRNQRKATESNTNPHKTCGGEEQ
jgi:RNA polymerase sigma factor (sigma-70 family)